MTREEPTAPTQRLVEFYREKVRELRSQYFDLVKDVEACKELASSSAFKEDEATRQLRDTADLQETLSEMQLCLFREREHVLRLTKENDRLKLDKLEDRRKIDFLLNTAGLHDSDLTLENRARRVAGMEMKKKVRFKEVKNFNKTLEEFKESEVDILRLKIQALEAQLQEETGVLKDEIISLTDDVEVRKKEWEAQKKVIFHRIHCLQSRLKNAQLFKFTELSSFLEELDKTKDREIKMVEKIDKLERCVSICKELLGDEFPNEKSKKRESSLTQLRQQLNEKDRKIEDFLRQNLEAIEQICYLREALKKIKEEKQKEKDQFLNRETYYKKKLEEEKKRRLLDSEGYMADIKLLRAKVQSIERQMRQESSRRRHHKE